MEHYNISGLSIALMDNSQISRTETFGVLEAGTSNHVNISSIFNACSISKFFTSMLVMKLTEQGIFDLDENVNTLLTSWRIPDNVWTQNKNVTLRRLLCHQAGLLDPKGSFAELDSTQIPFTIVELLEGRTPYCNEPIHVKYEPESEFHYSDAGFCIIQQLIEDVIEKPFKEVMDEVIFEPLKIKNSTLETVIYEAKRKDFSCGHNKNGVLVKGKYPIYPYPAASGLWATPSDIAILVIELMNSLKGESKIGISANKAKEMISAQGSVERAGLGLFRDGSEREIEISSLGWGVGFQCMMVAYPYKGNGIVIMTNADLGVHQLKGIIGEVYHSLSF